MAIFHELSATSLLCIKLASNIILQLHTVGSNHMCYYLSGGDVILSVWLEIMTDVFVFFGKATSKQQECKKIF